MVNLTIDGKQVQTKENTTILEAARAAGIYVPSLCYLKDINEIGACRVCVVEVEGVDKLISSCNNVVSEGMVVYTNSPRVREVRKTNVELILSQHDSPPLYHVCAQWQLYIADHCQRFGYSSSAL